MNRPDTIANALFYTLLAAVSAGACVAFLRPALAQTDALRERRDAIVEENRRLESEIHDLRRHLAELNTNPEYIEKIARDHGYVGPSELVFVIEEEP